MGIKINDTMEKVLKHHRRRRHREEIFNTIEQEIANLRLRGLTQNEDVRLWKAGDDNYRADFRSKATWNLIRVERVKIDWYKGIWFPYNTPRYSFMIWIAVQNRLPTGERILNWNTAAPTACSLRPSRLKLVTTCFTNANFQKKFGKISLLSYCLCAIRLTGMRLFDF